MGPNSSENGPPGSQIWIMMVPPGVGLVVGRRRGNGVVVGPTVFSKIFGPSVLKPKRERRPKEETRKIERSFRCSRVGLSTIAS